MCFFCGVFLVCHTTREYIKYIVFFIPIEIQVQKGFWKVKLSEKAIQSNLEDSIRKLPVKHFVITMLTFCLAALFKEGVFAAFEVISGYEGVFCKVDSEPLIWT